MSYPVIYGHPDDLKIYCNPSGQIEITFTCPRCEQLNYHVVDPLEFIGQFEVECDHPTCKAWHVGNCGHWLTIATLLEMALGEIAELEEHIKFLEGGEI